MPSSVLEDGATSPQGSDALSAPSFKRFSRLPLELRRQIWLLALPAPGIGPDVCLLSPYRPLTVRNPYSSLMGTSREARETALESFPLTRDYDPETDILYVSSANFNRFCNMCWDEDWPSQIQHLALELPLAGGGSSLPIAMKNMDRLQTISVVYPKATGMVDVHEHVLLPKQPHVMLRRFTEVEMDAFKINADYWYDGPICGAQIVWTNSAREHLDLFEEQLALSASSERPPCWDDETRSLRLTFEARCFEVVGDLQNRL